MKKIVSFLSFALFLASAAPSVYAQAHLTADANAVVETRGQGDIYRNPNIESSLMSQTGASTTGSDVGEASSTIYTDIDGEFIAETHKNAAASFVESLRTIADREEDIGPRVRTIAEAQEDSAGNTTNAIEKVDSRNALQSLVFGSDYKNLGVLKNAVMQTRNNLARLESLLASTNSADHATLLAQIRVLKEDRANIQSFIAAHEDTFSLFGWFMKLL